MRDRWRRTTLMPHYTPKDWWECDIFELTPSGYFREYEAKTTRSDFFADARKSRKIKRINKMENKHELLAGRDPRGPVQFWFVTPVGLVQPEEVPEWAGLIEVKDTGRSDYSIYWPRHVPHEVVVAPRLHNKKAYPRVKDQVLKNCYYRMHNMLVANIKQNEYHEIVSQAED